MSVKEVLAARVRASIQSGGRPSDLLTDQMAVLPPTVAVNGHTRVVVLMAWPSVHLRTPGFFNTHCVQRGINAVMVPWEVRPEHLARAWLSLRYVENLAGIVVTMPHKQTAALLCDRLDGDASVLTVVNVVRKDHDGQFTGRILDGVGLIDGMLRRGIALNGKRVLLVGAGGVATAIALAVARQGVERLRIANRNLLKANRLAQLVTGAVPGVRVETGSADARDHDILINATSLGMSADDPLPIDLSGLSSNAVVAEAVMQPANTPLLAAAAERGARIHLGEHMLTAQLDHFFDFLLPDRPPESGIQFGHTT